MLRLSSILQLQTVWESIPAQPSRPSSQATISVASSVRTKPASLLAVATEHLESLEEQSPQQENEEEEVDADPITIQSLSPESPLPASSLPAPPVSPPASVHTDVSTSTCDHSSEFEYSKSDTTSAALINTVPTIQITQSDDHRPTTSSMFETSSTKEITTQQRSQSSPTNTKKVDLTTPPTSPVPPLPPVKYPPPPPVPSKEDLPSTKIINNTTNNKADDNADTKPNAIPKKSSRYGFLSSRSSATTSPPASIHSSTVAPSSALITGANKALRRESSKINMRRKSLSKKLKKAISTIKLNGDAQSVSN